MLEYLRNAADKPVAKILIGLLMFSFVGWGVAEWIFGSNSRDDDIVRIGDEKISINQFNAERSREMQSKSKEVQKQIYTDNVLMNQFNRDVLSKITNRTMLENRANDLGFIVTDKEIVRRIRDNKSFQENGKFSEQKFDRAIYDMGFNEKGYIEDLRNQILREMVMGGLNFPVKTPEFSIRATYNARYMQKQIEYSLVKFDNYKVAANPTDDQLREVYAKNPKIIPETRTVSYVLVPAKMEAPDSYDKGFVAAQKLEDSIIGGETMSSAAQKNGAKFVMLPAFSADKKVSDPLISDQMVSKIFGLEQGIESEIIETKSGFLIARVEKIEPEHTASFESVKNSLISTWKKEEQKKQAYLRANEMLIKLKEKNVLDGKTSVTVSRVSGAPMTVLTAVFANKAGTKTIIEGQNEFFVLNVDKEILPKPDVAKMQALRKELQNIESRGLLADYNAFLIREYPVKLNTKMYNKLFVK